MSASVRLAAAAVLCLTTAGTVAATDDPAQGFDGRALMEAVNDAHEQYPFIYEELSMLLIDRRRQRSARQVRRYSRVEDDGTGRLLLIFDAPVEVEGVALLASQTDAGIGEVGIYLPALGGRVIYSDGGTDHADFLGTDFTVENFAGERLDDYRYVRRRSRSIGGVVHHVVDVFDRRDDVRTARAVRRHFIRADVLFITMTEHYDELGRIAKRQSTHDLRQVDGSMWRGNMILMEDVQDRHSTLIKIDRRVFSRDYVPAEMFTERWLVANHPPPEPEDDAPTDPESDEDAPVQPMIPREGEVAVLGEGETAP